MKPTVPIFCGAALAAMCTAVVGHWWSVRQFVAAIHSGTPVAGDVRYTPLDPTPAFASPLAKRESAPPIADADQRAFFQALTRKIEDLEKQNHAFQEQSRAAQNQNRDLLDQQAETNRDLMKVEFRLDTMSDSFRPMPVSEDRPDTTLDGDDGSGVLPPRVEPIFPATHD